MLSTKSDQPKLNQKQQMFGEMWDMKMEGNLG